MSNLLISIVNILVPAAIMLAVAALFAVLIVVLGKKLAIKTDERIEKIESLLSGANCGGCGYPGCSGFAKALAEGKAELSSCGSTSPKNKAEIAQILGVGGGDDQPTVAVVHCHGGSFCQSKYEYQGYGDCRTAELLAGGRKECPVGCIGLGTCVDACPHYAVEVGENGYAEVNPELCVSCGLCIKACPKRLIGRIPVSAKVYIGCSNECKGREVKEYCTHGCIGCTLCSKVCPEKAITMQNNLPVIDYAKCIGCGLCAEKCPVKCIITR